jgi:hypothetical protein
VGQVNNDDGIGFVCLEPLEGNVDPDLGLAEPLLVENGGVPKVFNRLDGIDLIGVRWRTTRNGKTPLWRY